MYLWMNIRLLSALIMVCNIRTTRCHNPLEPNTSNIIRSLLSPPYDPSVPPFDINGVQLEVAVNIDIRHLSSISDTSMDYVFNGYVRQKWTDFRLTYPVQQNYSEYVVLDYASASKIWQPDLYIPVAKGKNQNQFAFFRIYPNGTVYCSKSYSILLSCSMDLHKFPLDNQTCGFVIETYAYTENMMKFTWEPLRPVQVVIADITTPQFTMTGYNIVNCNFRTITGKFSCIKLNMMLSRSVGYYMIQVFIPTILIVIISWINFWINHRAVPARIAMAVTCVLTMVTQGASIRSGLPKVSYIKAIDVWMVSCLIFVFAALFEYAVVNVLSRKETPHYYEVNKKEFKVEQDQDIIKGQDGRQFMIKYLPVHNRERKARAFESLARRVFPLAFITFNLVFWLVYYIW